MQNIKIIISNYNMNIVHQKNKIKDGSSSRIKKYCPLGRKCLLPIVSYQGCITLSQPSYTEKF